MGFPDRRGLSKRKIAIWVPRAEIRADTPARGPLSLIPLYHSRLDLSIVNFNKKKSEFSFTLCFHFSGTVAAICNAIRAFLAPLTRTENLHRIFHENIVFIQPSMQGFGISFLCGFCFDNIGLCIDLHNPVFHVTSPVLPVRARRSALH